MDKEYNKGIRYGALLCLIMGIMLIGVVSAYQVGNNNLIFNCKLVNPATGASQIPSNSATFNISIFTQNGTNIVSNVQTDALGQGAFNYTVNLPNIDTYTIQERCYDGVLNSSDQEYITTTSDTNNTATKGLIFLFIGAFAFLILSMFVEVEELFLFISGVLFLVGGMLGLIYGFGDLNSLYTQAIGIVGIGVGMLFIISSYLVTIRDGEDEKSWDAGFDEDD